MQPTGNVRPLPYPLYYSEDTESETPSDVDITFIDLEDWPTSDPDERVDIILNLSLNEYVALATAIDVGRDIAYGGNSIYVWWIWVRAIIAMDICSSVADCIETSEAVQDALFNYTQNRGIISVPNDNQDIDSPAISGGGGCDPDVVFGQVTAVWDVINQTTIDFLEIVSAAGNAAEAVSMTISAIPIIGQLPADEIIDFVGKFGEWTLDAYNAFYTTAIENEIRCDLFCLALDSPSCVLSTGDLIDYFAGKVGALSTVRVETIEDFIQFIVDLPTNSAILFICGMALAQLYIVSLLEKFLGFSTIQAYIAFAQLGDPSNDWEGICDECAWTYTFDSTNLDDWAVTDAGGSFDGTKWISTIVSGSTRIHIGILFAETRILSVEVTYHTAGPTGSRAVRYPVLTGGTTYGLLNTGAGDFTTLIENDLTIEGLAIAVDSTGTSNANNITEIVVTGLGDNPFV